MNHFIDLDNDKDSRQWEKNFDASQQQFRSIEQIRADAAIAKAAFEADQAEAKQQRKQRRRRRA